MGNVNSFKKEDIRSEERKKERKDVKIRRGHYDHLYLECDKEVIFNETDKILKPIHYKLPICANVKDIEGYGLPPNLQKWNRAEMPKRLQELQDKMYSRLEDYWREITENYEYYEDELKFIEREWERRRKGFWLYINGKPTYITGWMYFYLTYFKMYNDSGGDYADYRDRDRKFFLMCEYCATTTLANFTTKITNKETGEVRYTSGKEKLNPLEYDVDHSGHEIDMLVRTVLGFNYPKLRREGATTKVYSILLEIATRMKKAKVGMQSMTEKSSMELYNEKMLPAWRGLPFFFIPLNPDNNNPQMGITMSPPKKKELVKSSARQYTKNLEALYSQIIYGTSSEKFFDGQMLKAYNSDEAGKTTEADVYLRHDIVKKTLTLGDGKIIIGVNFTTSTVEDMDKGGEEFKKLCKDSHSNNRADTGQTLTGNINFFIPSDEGLEGFIDEWGNSRRAEARKWIIDQREGYRRAGNNEKLIELIRRAPLEFSEAFTSAVKNKRFPTARMVDRRDKFTFEDNPHCRYGRLEWASWTEHKYKLRNLPTLRDFVSKKTYVRFVECAVTEQWDWELSNIPSYESSNRFFIDYAGVIRPANAGTGVIGADPIKMAETETGSNYGIAVFLKRNPGKDNPLDNPLTIDKKTGDFVHTTNRFAGLYCRRPIMENEGDEQCLMACLLFGFKCFPEINVTSTKDWFKTRGFSGYLLHKIDTETGEEKKLAGATTGTGIINTIFNCWNYYLLENVEREHHMRFIKECLEIEANMSPFDAFVAGGYALMGATQEDMDFKEETKEETSRESYIFVETFNN